MKQISSAFVKAQQAFGPAIKNAKSHQNKYADLGSCFDAVIDAFHKNEIAVVQQTHESLDGVIVETIFLHASGEQMSGGKLFVPFSKKDAQGFGSALTYARRYSLMASCGLAPEDDDGKRASEPAKETKPKLSNSRFDAAVQKIKTGDYTTEKLRDTFTLTAEQESALVQALANA
jgi:hypothetical protein